MIDKNNTIKNIKEWKNEGSSFFTRTTYYVNSHILLMLRRIW